MRRFVREAGGLRGAADRDEHPVRREAPDRAGNFRPDRLVLADAAHPGAGMDGDAGLGGQVRQRLPQLAVRAGQEVRHGLEDGDLGAGRSRRRTSR